MRAVVQPRTALRRGRRRAVLLAPAKGKVQPARTLPPGLQMEMGHADQVERPVARFKMPEKEYSYLDVSRVAREFSLPGEKPGEIHTRVRDESLPAGQALARRTSSTLSLELFVVAADDSPYAQETANIVRAVFGRIKGLRRVMRRLLDADFDGTAFCEAVYAPDKRLNGLWGVQLLDIPMWHVAFLRGGGEPVPAFRRPSPERYQVADPRKLIQHHGPGATTRSPWGGPGLGELVYFYQDLWTFILEKALTGLDVRTIAHLYLTYDRRLQNYYGGMEEAQAALLPVLSDIHTDHKAVIPRGAEVHALNFNPTGEASAFDMTLSRLERLMEHAITGTGGDFNRSKSTAGSAEVAQSELGNQAIQSGADLSETLTKLAEHIAEVDVGPEAPSPQVLLIDPKQLQERRAGLQLAEEIFGGGSVDDEDHGGDDVDHPIPPQARRAAFIAQRRGGLARCHVRF